MSKDILFLNIANPPVLGIYEQNRLISKIRLDGKTSEELPKIFQDLINKYALRDLIYINTPGSYMSIKLAFVFFKTLSCIKNYQIFAAEGFLFNENSPIKAMGSSFFTKKGDKILIQRGEFEAKDLVLPKILQKEKFVLNGEPIYITPPV